MTPRNSATADETQLEIGRRAIHAYSRLAYTMWYALAEFIDNSTQARENYDDLMDEILKAEGQPLIVEIEHNRLDKTVSIGDNSIGMTKDDLVQALKIAHPTKDSRGRSKYGMGMKTAACWIGERWRVVTCEWGSGEEWTAEIDVNAIVHENASVPLTMKEVDKDAHYTRIEISGLHRTIQKRTEENIRSYLGSMYRFDIQEERLKIIYNGEEIPPPDDFDFDTDPDGRPMRLDLPEIEINGKKVCGWIGVLRKGGRKWGGFSLFRTRRMIQGFPKAWKPRSIFGGVDDEGANNLISQRLTGVIELDGFDVSHTKDAILFEGDEEEELEKMLETNSRDYRSYALKRRTRPGTPWSREKLKDLLEEMKKEFGSDEMRDSVESSLLPPLETILLNNQNQLDSTSDDDELVSINILDDLRVRVLLQERSENDPHLTIVSAAEAGTIHVIINNLHPYYADLESSDQADECIRQYLYDAIAEYRVHRLNSRVNPDSVRRIKDQLLRVKAIRFENAASAIQQAEIEAIDAPEGA